MAGWEISEDTEGSELTTSPKAPSWPPRLRAGWRRGSRILTIFSETEEEGCVPPGFRLRWLHLTERRPPLPLLEAEAEHRCPLLDVLTTLITRGASHHKSRRKDFQARTACKSESPSSGNVQDGGSLTAQHIKALLAALAPGLKTLSVVKSQYSLLRGGEAKFIHWRSRLERWDYEWNQHPIFKQPPNPQAAEECISQ